MTPWQWFTQNGDKLFAFLAAASLALKAMSWMPAWAANAAEAIGVLATLAHQIFFSNTPGPSAPKGTT